MSNSSSWTAEVNKDPRPGPEMDMLQPDFKEVLRNDLYTGYRDSTNLSSFFPANRSLMSDVEDFMDIGPLFDLSERDFMPDDLPSGVKAFFIVSYTLIMVLSVLGNLLVIGVVAGRRKMRTVTNTFLVSLAVSDLLIAR